MAYIIGIGDAQYKVEDDGRVFTIGGIEVNRAVIFGIHTGKTEGFKCSKCIKEFDSKRALRGHMMGAHKRRV